MLLSTTSECKVFDYNKTLVLFEYSECILTDLKLIDLANSLESYEAYFYSEGISVETSKSVKPFQIIQKIHERERFMVKFKTTSYIGFGVISGYMVNVLPKIFRKKRDMDEDVIYRIVLGFLRMLDKAYGLELPKKVYYAPSELKTIFSSGLHEAILYLYAHLLYNELLRGAYREYREYTGDERFLQGKLLLTRQILKLPTRQHLFNVRYHRLSADNQLNRVLYYASLLGKKHTNLYKTRQLLDYITSILDDAKTIIPPAEKNLVFNRLNERFKPIYNLAKIIIHGFEPEPISQATGLFFDMNELFEKYVYTLLLESLGNKYQLIYQEELPKIITIKDPENNQYIIKTQRPDITIKKNNLPILYIDAKYRSVENDGEVNLDIDDIRQLYVYLKILKERYNPKTPGVIIVYPYIEGLFNNIFSHYKEPLLIGEFNISKDIEKLYIVGLDMKHLIEEKYQIPPSFTKTIENIIECQV